MSIDQKIGQLEILAIKGYRSLSYPVYSLLDFFHINQVRCRYTPSCSYYTEQAIREWGALKGTMMGFKRILRCNPYRGYGSDPVPKKKLEIKIKDCD